MDNGEKNLKDLVGEDDVPTLVGICAVPGPSGGLITFAEALIDYKEMTIPQQRDDYARQWEEAWREGLLDKGVILQRLSDTMIRVTSLEHAVELGKMEKVASFYTDLEGVKDAIDLFYERMAEQRLWILHIRTTLHSYIWMVDPEGKILRKLKTDKPKDIKE